MNLFFTYCISINQLYSQVCCGIQVKKCTLSPSGSFCLIYFLFSCFSNSIIKVIQNDSVVYRYPSGVEKHNGSGCRHGIVSKSKGLKESEEISTKDSAEKLLGFHSTELKNVKAQIVFSILNS